MPTPRYGRSPWLDRTAKSRVPTYPRQKGTAASEVVIVGGGLTGCAAAYAFAAAGVKVMLFEAASIGAGATSSSCGLISDDPGVEFMRIEQALGLRAARRAWQSWRRASLDFQALLRRLNVRCDLEPRPSVTIALSAEQTTRLKREQQSRRGAGLDASLLTARAAAAEVAVAAPLAMRSKDSATFDPYRATLALAAAAAARGAQLFEGSAVKAITFTRKHADVKTTNGAIRTRRVVVATSMPGPLFRALDRHFWFHTSYAALTAPVQAAVRRQLGRRAAVLRDTATPPHIVRWVDDQQLMISGADGPLVPEKQRARALVQRTGQLMYELSTLYPDISGIAADRGWAAPYARTADGLPYIGAHRNYPHHLFAFGDSSHSATGAYLASRIFLREHLGEHDPADEVFGFHR